MNCEFSKLKLLLVCPDVYSNAAYAIDLFIALFKDVVEKKGAFLVLPSTSSPNDFAANYEMLKHMDSITKSSTFASKSPISALTLKTIMRDRPAIVHFQHEYRWFNYSSTFVLLLLATKMWRCKAVVTLHSLMHERLTGERKPSRLVDKIRFGIAKLYVRTINRLIFSLSDAIIVHSNEMKSIAKASFSISDRIYVIPHGGPDIKTTRAVHCSLKESTGSVCVLVPGYIDPRKGQDFAAEVFAKLSDAHVNAHVHILGKVAVNPTAGRDFLNKLTSISKAYKETIIIDDRYLSFEDLIAWVATCDIVFLPYRKSIGGGPSQSNGSGMLSIALGQGKPVVASNIPYFEEILSTVAPELLFESDSVNQAFTLLKTIVTQQSLRSSYSATLENLFVNSLSWSAIADKHMTVYNRLLQSMGCDSL